jgi:hypothetical protein
MLVRKAGEVPTVYQKHIGQLVQLAFLDGLEVQPIEHDFCMSACEGRHYFGDEAFESVNLTQVGPARESRARDNLGRLPLYVHPHLALPHISIPLTTSTCISDHCTAGSQYNHHDA